MNTIKYSRGITLTQTLVSTAIVGVLTAIAVPSYSYYTKKAYIAEAFNLFAEQQNKIETIKQLKSCVANGGANTITGKYGTLAISGTYKASAGPNCQTGCILSYTLNSNVPKDLQGKVITANLLNNGKVSKDTSTSVPNRYLPSGFTQVSSTSENCAALNGTANITNGSSLNGNSTSIEDPNKTNPNTPNGGNNSNSGSNGGNNSNSGSNGGNESNGGNSNQGDSEATGSDDVIGKAYCAYRQGGAVSSWSECYVLNVKETKILFKLGMDYKGGVGEVMSQTRKGWQYAKNAGCPITNTQKFFYPYPATYVYCTRNTSSNEIIPNLQAGGWSYNGSIYEVLD